MVCRLTAESTVMHLMKFAAAAVSNSEMMMSPAQPRLPPFGNIVKNGLLADAGGLIQRRKRMDGVWLVSSLNLAFLLMKRPANQALQHNDRDCHGLCRRTLRASHSRG